jgi:hypothetical protein
LEVHYEKLYKKYAFDIEALRVVLAGGPTPKTTQEMEAAQPSMTKKKKRKAKTSENPCKGLQCACWKCRHNPGIFRGNPTVSADSKCPSCYEIKTAVRYTKAAEKALLIQPEAIKYLLEIESAGKPWAMKHSGQSPHS